TLANTLGGTLTFDATLNTILLNASQNWANNSSQSFVIASSVAASGGPVTLTLNGSGSGGANFSGVLGDGDGALAVAINTTGGTTVLSGANTYSGGTTLTAGTLQGLNSAATNVLSSFGTGQLNLNGGTLQLRADGTGS